MADQCPECKQVFWHMRTCSRAPDSHPSSCGQCAREIAEAKQEIQRLRYACIKTEEEIQQTLGKALGYPWYKDDQKNFPAATEEHGVCVGDHVAETLAMEAARTITEQAKRIIHLREQLKAQKVVSSYANDVAGLAIQDIGRLKERGRAAGLDMELL